MENVSCINLTSVVELSDIELCVVELFEYELVESIKYPDFSEIPAVRRLFICLFIVELMACVLGNAFVCITVYRNKALHSPVNYFIVNSSICDILIGVFVLPNKLYELTADASVSLWADVWCSVVRYMETSIVFVNMLTAVAICSERYYAVVHPIERQIRISSARIAYILAAVWILPCILAAPNAYPVPTHVVHLFSDYGESNRTYCADGFPEDCRRMYFITMVICLYLFPLLLLAWSGYVIFQVLTQPSIFQPHVDPRLAAIEKSRKKVAKMVVVVVLAFTICWSPYFIVLITAALQSRSFRNSGQYYFTSLCIHLLVFANSCFNPIVYFVMSERFREGFTSVVCTLLCIQRHRGDERSRAVYLRRGSRPSPEIVNGLILENLRRPAPIRSF